MQSCHIHYHRKSKSRLHANHNRRPGNGYYFRVSGRRVGITAVQQIKVSGAAISGNMSATAPTGFEISLSAGAGYGSSLTLVPTAGAVNTTVYVRASATAASGA